MLSGESLLGIPIQAFADTVIGFLVFGTALMMTGAGKFFINLSFAMCGTFRGGAAKVCIFASGLLGMMSGSIISNVLTAGTMTIPVMKKSGFRASYAAAIEACASTGAVLAPPVMGATAFVIAQFLNVSYADVALAAIIPAVLFYAGLFMQVDSYAARHGLKGIPRSELPKVMDTIKDGWYYIFVIALLIVMLLYFKRESHAPFYATALLLVLNQLFSRETRWTFTTINKFFEVNGRTFVELVGILAGCGLLIGAFSMTGVVSSLANDLLRIAGDNAFLLLGMCAFTSLVLGLGLTTTACYIFLAILVAPALEKVGLNKMAVHMFIFYWGMLSSITPPVAIASFAAAGIAGSPAMRTGWESMWVGSIIYFIPFFFVMNPALVLQGNNPYFEGLGLMLLAGVGTLFICGGIQGYQAFVGDLRRTGMMEWPLRVLLVIGGFVLATPGGGINPLSQLQITSLGLAILIPTVAVAVLLMRRQPLVARPSCAFPDCAARLEAMKQPPPAFAAAPALLGLLEAAAAAVPRPLPCRFLRRRPAAPSPTTFRNSARPTLPISASASPPSTATSTRPAIPAFPSRSSRCRNPSCSRWRWIRWVRRGWRAPSGSNRQAIPSIRSGSMPTTIPSTPWSTPARSPAPA